MCSAAAGIGLLVAGQGVKAYGDFEAAGSEAEAARAMARIRRAQGDEALNIGGSQAGQLRMKGSRTRADARLALIASGVEVDSATDVLDTTSAYAELDAQTAKANAARQAWGYYSEADEMERKAKAAERRKLLGAAGSILGLAGQLSSMGGGAPGGGPVVDKYSGYDLSTVQMGGG